MMSMLQLIRWKNLVLISICQIIMIWSIYTTQHFSAPIIIYIICTFCFAAGGNIINDIFDVIPDKVNKPHKVFITNKISIKTAYYTYYCLNIFGLLLTVYGSYLLQNFSFIFYGVFIVALLYIYSAYLKGIALIGNIIIAFFTSLSLLFLLLIIPSTPKQTSIILILAVFSFLINWIREMIKDIEDIKGDKKANLKTLPIVIGIKRTVNFIRVITFLTTIGFVLLMYIVEKFSLKLYIFITLALPLSYIFIILKNRSKKHYFTKISKILKLIILFGIFTILFG